MSSLGRGFLQLPRIPLICKLVLVEPYFDLKTPNSIGAATGAKVLVYLPSVGGEKQVTNYFELFDYDIALIKKAMQ